MKTRSFPRNQVWLAIQNPERIFGETMKAGSKEDVLRQLAKDIQRRTFAVDGYISQDPDVLWKKADELVTEPNKSTNAFEIELTRFLKSKSFSDKNIDQLVNHYTQQPTYGPRRAMDLMQEGEGRIAYEEDQYNLFLKNGEVYCSGKVKGLFIRDPFNAEERLQEFAGEAEVGSVFALTDDGFKFQEFTASEDLIPVLANKIMTPKVLSMTIQTDHVWREVNMLYPNKKERNVFLQKLCEYQIENITEIYTAQLQLAAKAQEKIILGEVPTYRDFLNKQTPGIGDKLYEGKKDHNPEVKVLEERYKKVIVPKQAEEHVKQQASANIAFNLLISIQRMIFSSTWQLGTFGGVEVSSQDGTRSNLVPKNMVKILAVIDNAFKKDRTGSTMIWLDALNEAALIGRNAADNKPFKLFGARDAATQEFYDHFVTAYENRDKSHGRKHGKKK